MAWPLALLVAGPLLLLLPLARGQVAFEDYLEAEDVKQSVKDLSNSASNVAHSLGKEVGSVANQTITSIQDTLANFNITSVNATSFNITLFNDDVQKRAESGLEEITKWIQEHLPLIIGVTVAALAGFLVLCLCCCCICPTFLCCCMQRCCCCCCCDKSSANDSDSVSHENVRYHYV